jgi:predicted RNase H-like HicB family nuclease
MLYWSKEAEMASGMPSPAAEPEDGDDIAVVERFPVLDIHPELLRHLVPNPTIEYAGGEEGWIVTAPEYRGCIGTGVTQVAALDDFYSALREWLSLSAYKQLPVPPAALEIINTAHVR